MTNTRFYTAGDLRHLLGKVRGSPVPKPTLKYWRSKIGIFPDSQNLYYQSDLEMLTALVRWLAQARTIGQFLQTIETHKERQKERQHATRSEKS